MTNGEVVANGKNEQTKRWICNYGHEDHDKMREEKWNGKKVTV